jgi:hypothetical protein
MAVCLSRIQNEGFPPSSLPIKHQRTCIPFRNLMQTCCEENSKGNRPISILNKRAGRFVMHVVLASRVLPTKESPNGGSRIRRVTLRQCGYLIFPKREDPSHLKSEILLFRVPNKLATFCKGGGDDTVECTESFTEDAVVSLLVHRRSCTNPTYPHTVTLRRY